MGAGTFGPGQGGGITVTASEVELRDGGTIASSGLGSGRAGDVMVVADTVALDDAQILTRGLAAEGGLITVRATDSISLAGAQITSSGIMPGEGDSIITLQAPTIVLNSSQVESLTGAGEPLPGSGEARLLGDLTVISPDSEVAASSTVEVSGLESDITAGIEVLPGAFFDVSGQLRASCAARQADNVSSFVAAGQGGVAPGPEALLPGSYAELVETAPIHAAGSSDRLAVAAFGGCDE